MGWGRWLWAACAEECVFGRCVFVYNALSDVPFFTLLISLKRTHPVAANVPLTPSASLIITTSQFAT